ncbi:MAG: methyltransferase [Planctomycetia bacterium]|nr:methyltransferase [Planctomycetia bacterium]
MPATPSEVLGPTVREQVFVEDQTFIITRPDKVDRLSGHRDPSAGTEEEEYIPFWADLWPAARMLAKAILKEPWPQPVNGQPLTAMEIGCGLGLAGVVALSRGLRVIFSDYDATALRYAADNARINGYRDFDVLQLDWRQPPPGLQVPVVLGSDLIYQMEMAPVLAALLKKILAPGGVVLLADQERVPAPAFREALATQQLAFTQQPARAGAPGVGRVKGSLYRITHA